MTQRGWIIAVLFVFQLGIVGEAVVAVQAGQYSSHSQGGRAHAAGPALVEGGAHKIFAAGAQPTLTVDIGYADLTIQTNDDPNIDVALGASTMSRFFGDTGPIAATKDGNAVRIAIGDRSSWSTGDDRMVTVLVPADTRVTVLRAGDIKVNGLRAGASLNSIGRGSITVEDYDAPTLKVVTSNGGIVLHRIIAAHLDATSNNDSVDGTGLQVRDGDIESDDRVTLGFASGSDTVVSAGTKDGKIRTSGFDSAAITGKSGGDDDSSSQTLRVGAGDGHLDVHTSDGNIDLSQEG